MLNTVIHKDTREDTKLTKKIHYEYIYFWGTKLEKID